MHPQAGCLLRKQLYNDFDKDSATMAMADLKLISWSSGLNQFTRDTFNCTLGVVVLLS